MNATDKFNPKDCGFFKRNDADGEEEYVLLDDKYRAVGKLFHTNYFQGLPIEWTAYKFVHCCDGKTKEHIVFEGRIPTNVFAKELFKNLFF